MPVLRPVPGLSRLGFVPTACAVGYFLPPSGLGVEPISGGWFE
jgi:hypothetical protein